MKLATTTALLAAAGALYAEVINMPIVGRTSELAKRNSIEHKVHGFYTNVSIGEPARNVEMLLDTGSGNIWLDDKYVQNSKTLKTRSGQWSKIYHGLKVQGKDSEDTVKFEGKQVKNQRIGVVYNLDGDAPSAVFGIGPNSKLDNFPASLKKAGVIKRNAFAVYMSDSDKNQGSVLFGGYDRKKYKGALVAIPMEDTTVYSVPGKIYLTTGSFHANLDTSQQYNYLPKAILDEVAQEVGASYDAKQNIYLATAMPKSPLMFRIGGSEIQIAPQEYMKRHADGYMLAMKPTKQGQKSILGLPFMRSAYVVVDSDKKYISLAQASYSKESNIWEYGAVDQKHH